MRWWIKVQLDLPVTVRRSKLGEDLLKEFNEGKFVRTDYKYLYELTMDRKNGPYVKLATPSFRQLLHSIRVLWNAVEGQPYDRHEHPVIMTVFDTEEVEGPEMTEAQAEKSRAKFQKSYAKNRKLTAK